MQTFFVASVLVFAALEVKAQAATQCEVLGGECKLKENSCCPARMDYNPDLCHADGKHVCCLPGLPHKNATYGGGGGGNGQNLTGNGQKPSCGPCSRKHQQVLCDAKENYFLVGTTKYDPDVQVPEACDKGGCLAKGVSCEGPKYACLKHKILNLLQCAPHACVVGAKWSLISLLSSEAAHKGKDLCDGNSILFLRQGGQICYENNIRDMCVDVGGVYEKAGTYTYCNVGVA